MIITSSVKNAKISPRKLNLVANLVRESKAIPALKQLKFVNKKGAAIVASLLRSAISNAEFNNKINPESLLIKDIQVGPGKTIKAGRIKAKGSMHRIRKRSTNIQIVLEDILEVSPSLPDKSTENPKTLKKGKPEVKTKSKVEVLEKGESNE